MSCHDDDDKDEDDIVGSFNVVVLLVPQEKRFDPILIPAQKEEDDSAAILVVPLPVRVPRESSPPVRQAVVVLVLVLVAIQDLGVLLLDVSGVTGTGPNPAALAASPALPLLRFRRAAKSPAACPGRPSSRSMS